MTYEGWRISYQDSEHAARAAWKLWKQTERQLQMTEKCDCINACGDDVRIYSGTIKPCKEYKQAKDLKDEHDKQCDVLAGWLYTHTTLTAEAAQTATKNITPETLEAFWAALAYGYCNDN